MLQIYAPHPTSPRNMTAEDRCIWQSISRRYKDYEIEVAHNDAYAAEVPLLLTQHKTVAEAVMATIEAVEKIPETALQSWIIY